METHNIADATGVRVMAEMCSTCIFRPGNLMTLRPGRVKEMVQEAKGQGGVIVCHKTLDKEFQAVCQGFAATNHQCAELQIAERLGAVVPWGEDHA